MNSLVSLVTIFFNLEGPVFYPYGLIIKRKKIYILKIS